MNNINGQGFELNQPLFRSQTIQRQDFTPDVQENMIRSSFGLPTNNQTFNNNVHAKQFEDSIAPVNPPVNNKYENIDKLLQNPEVAAAIGRVLAGDSLGTPSPNIVQQPTPPQNVVASASPTNDGQSTNEDPFDKLWADVERTPNVDNNQNVNVNQNAQSSAPSTSNDSRSILLAEAAREGLDVKEFDTFMQSIGKEDFIQMFKSYKNTMNSTQNNNTQVQQPPAIQPTVNLAEAARSSNVRIGSSTFAGGNNMSYRV